MNDTYKHLEDLRHAYKQRYGKVLDDEVLLLIARMEELQSALVKEIKGKEKVLFRKGTDYFWYGVGKNLWLLLLVVALLIGFMYIKFDNKETVGHTMKTDTLPVKKSRH